MIEVTPDLGKYGIEFLLALTMPQYNTPRKEQEWTGKEMFDHFSQVVTSDSKTDWEETLKQDYHGETEGTGQNWTNAMDKFMRRYLNCHKPRDIMLRFMEGRCTKKALMPVIVHMCCWKESLHHMKKLPKGVKPNPMEEEIKEWFYRSFCKPHHREFIVAGNKLDNKTIKDSGEFMRLRQQEYFDNGVFDRLTRRARAKRKNDVLSVKTTC